MFDSLKLHNFTVFAEANFEFVKGINVYAGENGSGKTHILKLLYALQKNQFLANDEERSERLSQTLLAVFRPDAVKRLVRRPRPREAKLTAMWNQTPLEYTLLYRKTHVDLGSVWRVPHSPVFIPPTDILGHAGKFLQAFDKKWVDFDVTYRDLIIHAVPGIEGERIDDRLSPLVKQIQTLVGGQVMQSKDGKFYLQSKSGPIEFSLMAEGWRKLGLLSVLISNGSLSKGNVLFWDEPEANLNPSMYPLLAETLATLADTGIQIHISSHSYGLLRELEFATKRSKYGFRIFALDRTPDGVRAQPFERFVDLKPNPILAEDERLYRLTVQEALDED